MAGIEGITCVNLFIASSMGELREDRLALSDHIRKLNEIYLERGVYFKLFICEDEDAAIAGIRKQEEYNERIRASQLCFVIVFNHVGRYTLEEFEVAYAHFRQTGSPAIVTCFRQGANYNPEQSVLDFMQRLDRELGHYFTIYEHIDSLKLRLLLQLKLMNLDVPLEFRNGRLLAGGAEAMTLERLPAFARNAELQRLREEYEACESAFQAAKARYLANPDDDGDFLEVGARRQKSKQAMNALEESLFELLLGAEKASQERMTPRQREAYALLEQGKSREASAILDMKDILDDATREQALADQAKQPLTRRVEELLQKADIEKTLVDDTGRFDRIVDIYETAVALEERNGLPKQALKAYCTYLFLQGDQTGALRRMERYLKYMELEGSQKEIADAHYKLGVYSYNMERFEDARRECLRVIGLCEAQAGDDRDWQSIEATACNQLGQLYARIGQAAQAEAMYLRSEALWLKLMRAYPGRYDAAAAATFNSLGLLYFYFRRTEEAEAKLCQVKQIYLALAEKDPDKYLSAVAAVCCNLGILYGDTGRADQAEAEYLRAGEILDALALENPAAYLSDVARNCSNLGSLYLGLERFDDAEAQYLRSRGIRQGLVRAEPEVYLPQLATSCFNLGNLYMATGRFQDAEAQYLRSKEISEALASKDPRAHLGYLMQVYNNLIVLYYQKMGRPGEAEALHVELRRLQAMYAQIMSQ